MEDSEALQALEATKGRANELMKAGSYGPASEIYASVVQEIDSMELEGDDNLWLMRIACLNNLAMAYQKLGEDKLVIETCTAALLLNGENLKAFYRRSQSYMQLARLEDDEKEFPRDGKWIPSDYWALADADAACILNEE